MHNKEFVDYINSDIFFTEVIQTTLYKEKYTVDDIYDAIFNYNGDNQEKSDIKKTIKRNLLKMIDMQNCQIQEAANFVMKCNKRIEENICKLFNISQERIRIKFEGNHEYSIMEFYCIVALISDIGILKLDAAGNQNKEKSLEKIKKSADMIDKYIYYIQNQIITNIYDIVLKRDMAMAFWLKALIKAGLQYKSSYDESITFGVILLEVQKSMKEEYKKECIYIAKKDKSIDGKTGGKKLTQKEVSQIEVKVNEITKYFKETDINKKDYNETALQAIHDFEDVIDLVDYLSRTISFELFDLVTQISNIKIEYNSVEVDYDIFEIKNKIKNIQYENEMLLERISYKASQVQLLYCRQILNDLKQKLQELDCIVNPKKGEIRRKEVHIILEDNNIE